MIILAEHIVRYEHSPKYDLSQRGVNSNMNSVKWVVFSMRISNDGHQLLSQPGIYLKPGL